MSVSKSNPIKVLETIGTIEKQTSISDVTLELMKYTGSFGFTSIVVGKLTNPILHDVSQDNILATTWPDEWVKTYSENNYALYDPIAKFSLINDKPFTWHEAYEQSNLIGQRILDESRDFRFKGGLAIPIKAGFGPNGCISFGAENIDLSPIQIAHIELVSVHAYVHMLNILGLDAPPENPSLSKRETEIIHFAAEGKTNWEIATILSISEFSVRDHMSNIFTKLDSTNRAHAVSVAIRLGLIFA